MMYVPGTECLLQRHVDLYPLTSFRVGGPAEWFVAPRTQEELQASFEWSRSRGTSLTLLGAGSNLLVSDRGLPGLTIYTRHFRHLHFDTDTERVTAGAGFPINTLGWKAAKRGWHGLEWSVGIPGTVGGAVVMNAGAHKACVGDRLVSALVVSSEGRVSRLTPAELGFAYRTSSLQGKAHLVLEATFQLEAGDRDAICAESRQNFQHRKQTQPYHLPSCGSVFRNPPEKAAGWLIEQAGLKGYQIGGAQVARQHANFILNCGGATAADIFALIGHVQATVQQRWAIALRPEVQLLGEF